ncbi:MAG: hypothetical protein ACREQV_12935, partial [Candidatus Binatia bacterium]
WSTSATVQQLVGTFCVAAPAPAIDARSKEDRSQPLRLHSLGKFVHVLAKLHSMGRRECLKRNLGDRLVALFNSPKVPVGNPLDV